MIRRKTYKQLYRSKIKKSAKNNNKKYTKAEEIMILEHKISDVDLSKILNRTVDAISSKRMSLKRHSLRKDKVNIVKHPELTMDFIIDLVCSVLEIPVDEVKSRCRKRETVTARYICYFLIHENIKCKLSDIAAKLKRLNNDHSVVLYGLDVHNDLTSYKNPYRDKFMRVKEAFDLAICTP